MPRPEAALALLLSLAACSATPGNVQGPLQPQTTEGPCTVKPFFLLAFTAVHTDMAAAGSCTFTVLNPALQAFPTAVLVTEPPRHGRAEAGLANGGRSPIIRYTPEPGYAGPDRFTITIEPNDHAIAVAVTAGPPR